MGTSDPTANIAQPDEPANRRGRKVGSQLRYSKSSVMKLAELGVDPIEMMVQTYHEVTEEMKDMLKLKTQPLVLPNGDTRRFSAMAYAQLLTIHQKIAADLMRYGYGRVPETVKIEEKKLPGLTIQLTPKGGVFSAEDEDAFVIPVGDSEDDGDEG